MNHASYTMPKWYEMPGLQALIVVTIGSIIFLIILTIYRHHHVQHTNQLLDTISQGDSYQQVSTTIGKPGTLIDEHGDTQTYRWPRYRRQANNNRAVTVSIECTFTNNQLTRKRIHGI